MKKLMIFTLLLITITLTACGSNEEETFDFIDIYYLNDFHGAIEKSSDQIGMSGIGAYISKEEAKYPNNVLVLAGGDMLQGSALSNYYNGLSTIDLMDEIGFDAFALGNHEFDWGLETVTNYFDEDESNGEADFPLLGANVYLKGTTTLPDHIDPYTIVEKGDVKIGIIGTMGYGLERSIATKRIEDYEFANPVPVIEAYAKELRTEKDCDIVIWIGHDGGSKNDEIQALSGDSKIDALFNAHSHSRFIDDTASSPILQAGANGKMIGYVRLNLDGKTITDYTATHVNTLNSAELYNEYEPVEELLKTYKDETDLLFNTPIIKSADDFNQSELSDWIAELMRKSTGSDIGIQNFGGTRTSIDSHEDITLGLLYQIWPFDNVVKTVYLKGSVINNLRGYAIDTEIQTFDDNTLYKVATNDYVFDKPENPFLDGTDPINTGFLMRDLAENELNLQDDVYSDFNVTNELLTVDLTE